MIPSFIAAELNSNASDAEVARFIQDRSFPHVDGPDVTFAYHGEAEHVAVRHWIYGLPAHLPMERFGETNFWYHDVEFPESSRIEYKLGVTHHGHEEWIFDPLNPQIAYDPFGGNSVVYGSGYQVPDWSFQMPPARQGRIENLAIDSQVFGDRRFVQVYIPASFRTYRRYRLLIVHDGEDYLKYSQLNHVLDNLIARSEIPPLIVAMSNPHDRLIEYANCPRHARHIVEELIPELESCFPLIKAASGRGIMGASFGGVASLATAWRYPETFESLLVQSGSFAFTDIGEHSRSPVFDPVVEFMNKFRRNPGQPFKKAYISCGVYESLIYENRSLAPFMRSLGVKTKFEESYDGHNWENWRDRLRNGLSWLFPGPLWETYL